MGGNILMGRRTTIITTMVQLILDIVTGPQVAFSLIKRRSAYSGYAIRVRRSSDNLELDIPFTSSGLLDVSVLMAHVGSSSGYVTIWYDQSTNSEDAIQTSAASQPRIVNSGVIDIASNGLPTLFFDGVNDFMELSDNITLSEFTSFSVYKRKSNGATFTLFGDKSGVSGACTLIHYGVDNNYYFQRTNGYLQSNSADTSSSLLQMTTVAGSSTQSLYKNGSIVASTFFTVTLGTMFGFIGRYTLATPFYADGLLQEFFMYTSDKSAERTLVEQNQKQIYGTS